MKQSNDFLKKTESVISIVLCLFFLLFVFYRIVILSILHNSIDAYNHFVLPEIMINYQGGFVRRGLLGEIFYQIYQVHPYPLHTAVVYFEAIVFIVFLSISCYVFYKQKYVAIMPFAILVGVLTGYRRDFLMILMAFLIFYLIIRYIKSHHIWFLLVSVATMVVAILFYEPSFFFIVPICMLMYYQNIGENKGLLFRIVNTLLVFILPIVTMSLVCLSKGTEVQANAIWHSWIPLFDYLNMEQPETSGAIGFLSLSESVKDVAMLHLGVNYGIGDGCKLGFNRYLVGGSILFFVGMYFLTITTPCRDSSLKPTKLLSSIYLFQFVCLIPMFTILSCDFGRTILYVVFTSYYLEYFLFKHNIKLDISYIDNISDSSLKIRSNIPSHLCFVLHIFVIVFVPFAIWRGISITRPFFINEYWPIFQYKLEQLFSLVNLW